MLYLTPFPSGHWKFLLCPLTKEETKAGKFRVTQVRKQPGQGENPENMPKGVLPAPLPQGGFLLVLLLLF